jgi:ribosomal RNA-processing protein 36
MRPDRHAPTEISSSKQPVSVVRTLPILENTPKYKARDPRFDRSMGSYNPDLFRKSYTFVDEMQRQELDGIRELLRRDKNMPAHKRQDLERLLDRAKTKQKQSERDAKRHALVKEWREKESALVKEGKKSPYYLKKSDVRKMELVDEYKRIKASNPNVDVDKLVEKRRKRKASKQHRLLPNKH